MDWRNESLFCKLFKMPCPVPAHFGHYLNALHDTPYENLVHLHRHWLRLDLTVTDIHRAVSDFEADAIHDLQDFGSAARIGSVLRTPDRPVPTYDRRCEFLGRRLISVDMVEANYQTAYRAIPSLPENWAGYVADLISRTNRHPDFDILAKAKVLRQRIFGKAVGGAPVTRQLYQTARLDERLSKIFRDAAVQRSPDELTYLLETPTQLDDLVEAREEHGWRWRHQIFTLTKCSWGGHIRTLEDGSAELFGVPASRFYYVLAKALGRPVGELDRLFLSEDRLARWED